MKRTLSLKREALTSLTTAEMAAFGGAGDPQPTPPVYAPPTWRDCIGFSMLVCTLHGSACYC